MNAEQLKQLLPDEMIKEIRSQAATRKTKTYLDQYDPERHKIHDAVVRPYKRVRQSVGGVESDTLKDVSRLSVPFQKIIVDRAAAFLIGEGIKLISEIEPDNEAQKTMVEMVKKTWHDNKLDYKTRQLARAWMSETEVAEYWYFQDAKTLWNSMNLGEYGKFRMRMRIWSASNGDKLYPYFDEYGDMLAFARAYKLEKKEYMDVLTDERIQTYRKDGTWTNIKDDANQLEKIPVVYYTRPLPEWYDVQHLIERFETMISNFADQNDYFASPIILLKGVVQGFADKGDSGKMLQLEEDADARYLTWDQAPAAIETEKNMLQELIMSLTQTPDISFMQMKGIGALAGVAIRLMFMDAKLKCMKHEEEFGEGIQRRINIIKAGMSKINIPIESAESMTISPEFQFYMPQNDQEIINTLITATGNKQIMSQETAVENNPFTVNTEREMEMIKENEAGDFGSIMGE